MKNIEQLADETMGSLDGVQRAEANPYLYTRIVQRLANRHEPVYRQKLMPVLAVALVLFISLNMLSYFKDTDAGTGAQPNATSSIESFAKEYNLSEDTGF